MHQIDRRTGAIHRFVTGITWVAGDLWHGTSEANASELRRVDPGSGEVLQSLEMPAGAMMSGLEADGGALLY